MMTSCMVQSQHHQDMIRASTVSACTFHGLTQGWVKNKITTFRILQGSGNDIGVSILESLKNWVMSWTNDVESPEELQVSYELLMEVLDDHNMIRRSKHLEAYPTGSTAAGKKRAAKKQPQALFFEEV